MEDNVWQTLVTDELYKQFLVSEFDARNFATKALQDVTAAQQRAKLTAGINLVDKKLHDQVSEHYEDLLSQATRIETLEGVLQMMQNRIQTLVSASDCLRSKVVDPFSRMNNQTTMLARLQSTCEILRRILRIMYLNKRLQMQLKGGIKEITKAAQSLSELEYLFQGVNLNGIDVIDKDQRIIRNARKEVEKQAQQMLYIGMESHNQTQVATALQVFHNLDILGETVNKLIIDAKADLQKNVKDALDMKMLSQQSSSANLSSSKGGPGRAAIPTIGNTAAFRAALWTNIEKMMDKIYSNCANIHHLHVVLAKKKDPVSHVTFLDALIKDGVSNVMLSFWDLVIQILTEEFSKATENSSYLKQAFEGEYPKLLRLYCDLWKRLEQFNSSVSNLNGVSDINSTKLTVTENGENEMNETIFFPEKSLRDTLSSFENAYLSRSLSRLFDPINLIFSGSNNYAPTKDEVDTIVRTISSELSVANVDVILCKTVANNVAKTIKLFAVKCEQLLCTDSDASQVIDVPNAGQILNANIVNVLEIFHHLIFLLIDSLSQYPTEAKNIIEDALKSTKSLMTSAVQPLFSSVTDAVEAIILTIHNEDFSCKSNGSNTSVDVPCSLFMKELQSFVSRVQSDYLSLYTCEDFISQNTHSLACRTLTFFVQHACLLRPLGDGGKKRLAADCAQIESVVSLLCQRVSDLGKPYRVLRSFRPLLFQTPDHIVKSSSIGNVLPYSLVLHHLFSRAEAELQSPHQVMGWSITRYSQWLDENQSESDRFLLIQGSLESYVKVVTNRQGREYTPLYPIILELLQVAMGN